MMKKSKILEISLNLLSLNYNLSVNENDHSVHLKSLMLGKILGKLKFVHLKWYLNYHCFASSHEIIRNTHRWNQQMMHKD